MTRLSVNDIKSVPSSIQEYDKILFDITGASLKQIAAEATGPDANLASFEQHEVAIIPVTSGLGKIDGFSEAVRAICNHLGFQAFVTGLPDVHGLAEAYESNADIIMMADDHLFAAINLRTKLVVDNTEATAMGYTAALNFLVGGLSGKEVLLIGAGQLGRKAAKSLVELGADIAIYDIDKSLELSLAKELGSISKRSVRSGLKLDEALSRAYIIFDASSGSGFITREHVTEQTYVAAPGIPLGLDQDAFCKIKNRVVHDPLQIGVATMLYMSLIQNMESS